MHAFIAWTTALLLALPSFGFAAEPSRMVALTQIVEHPSLDAARRGILDELAAAGFVSGQNLTVNYQNAQGNPVTAAQIARQFAAEPDPRKWTDRRAVGFVGGCAAWRQGGNTLRQEYPELAEEFAAKHDGG